ncbi:BMP family ABC transporter substrate-binding protein [Phormidesmis priestleyi ULC007]|uniref:BMP family ABC transporter substrate-binding protein n=1 Tax=Phormidesmis priestleyi ULC007 TaxID=1920490 RepID=A0A2T1DDA7_9CYAN|nr:BMP family ABC transporter substrate-binding protein [Phormidesmis priestleyi ULC007]PZO48783.1 MAG: BMP family ABC transporter substrate-binding protein [Phormidesmis priestleyi]
MNFASQRYFVLSSKRFFHSLEHALVSFALTAPLMMLSACSSTPTTSHSPSDSPMSADSSSRATSNATKGKAAKFALIINGSPTDKSWNQQAVKATQALKAKGMDVAVSESVSPADAERVLRQYAEAGYGTIVAHSFNYGDAVFKVAKEFPNVNFAWAGGINKTAANVADYDQPFYQGAYLVGLIGAKLSKTGKLGALYGFDIPVCHSMGEAMLAGAKTVRPDATLTSAAVGNWDDVAKAKEAALSQAETGVDFWIGCGQGPTIGQIEAAKTKGGYATSYVGDMSSLGPQVVALNLLWKIEPLFSKMIEDIQAKKFANRYYKLGVADGVIDVEAAPGFKNKLTREQADALKTTRAKIASGELTVPFVPK